MDDGIELIQTESIVARSKLSEEVPSPCVKVCRLDSAGGCLGCGRNRQEIAAWPYASVAEKHEILASAAARLANAS